MGADDPQRRRRPSLGPLLLVSLALHAGAAAALANAARLGRLRPPPEPVLAARLVRLGELRPPQLLPEKATPPPPPPATPASKPTTVAAPPGPRPQPPPAPAARAPAPSPAVAAPPAAAAQVPLADRMRAIKRRLEGVQEGAVDGDVARAEDAAQGDRFISELNACAHRNWTVPGDPARFAGKQVTLWVRFAGNGQLGAVQVAASSGLATFDEMAVRALRACDGVRVPPGALRQRLQREGLDLDFTP